MDHPQPALPDPRRPSALLAALACVAVAVFFGFGGRGPLDPTSADQVLGRIAVQRMRSGESYYPAMDHALRATNGPARTGRAFRQPLVFEAWSVLPDETAIWITFTVLVGLAGAALALTSRAPLTGPLVAIFLLRTAQLDQHLLVELWAAPLVLLALAAWRRGWPWAAAALGTVAVLVRELTVLLLAGGLFAGRRRPAPWLVGLAVAVVGVGAHFAYANRYGSPAGAEAPLFGTGGIERAFDMAGVGFDDRRVAGLVLWPAAVLRLGTDRPLARFLAPIVGLPLVGLLVGRDYWGFVVAPVLLLLAAEGAWELIGRLRHRLAPSTAGSAAAGA